MSEAGSGTARRITVRQVRSGIGFDRKQNATLRALGLGRIGRRRQFPDNREVRGMIAKIPHLVVVEGPVDESREDDR